MSGVQRPLASRSLPRLASPTLKLPAPAATRRSRTRSGYGLGGLQRTSSAEVSLSGATTGGGSGAAAGAPASRGLPEVCSPPPSKPLNFAAPPSMPMSPSAAADDAAVTPTQPWHPQQLAAAGASRQHGSHSGGPAAGADWADTAETDDQENQQPCVPAATWLVSPVQPPRARGKGRSAPVPIPAPGGTHAGLLSPALMPTPAKEGGGGGAAAAASAASPSLTHAPSFSSWMVPATSRPPLAPAAACVDVADVVASLRHDPAAPRRLGGPAGAPTHLERLLAELGDSDYPASRGSLLRWLSRAARCGVLAWLRGLLACRAGHRLNPLAPRTGIWHPTPAVIAWEHEDLADSDGEHC